MRDTLRNTVLRAGGVALVLATSAHAQGLRARASASLPPNVLVLVADDLGVGEVGIYAVGSDIPSTPTLDALAQGGLLFRNAWSNPVCSPTRATILTGRHAFRTGIGRVVDPDTTSGGVPTFKLRGEEVTIAEVLRDGGRSWYATSAIGKWHLNHSDPITGAFTAPNLAGFQHFDGTQHGALGDYFSWTNVTNGTDTQVSGTYATTFKVDTTLAWLQTVRQPFFVYLAFHLPHSPFHEPPAHLHSVDVSSGTDRVFYKAMVEALDTEIGRLLSGLDALGLGENTLVLFVGDNGTPHQTAVAPYESNRSKNTLYQGGVNVPLIVAGPGLTDPGRESDALVHTADIFATVADLTQVDLPGALPPTVALDSLSLLPYLSDPAALSQRSYLVAESFRPNGEDAGIPVEPTGDPDECWVDLGFQGPGTADLSVLCNQGNLATDNSADLLLTGAPPNAAGILYFSFQSEPTPAAGGTLVPKNPIEFPFVTDASGEYVVSPLLVAGTQTHTVRYVQVAVEDPAQAGGYTISNAAEVVSLPYHEKAIRDLQGYKLISSVNTAIPGGQDELFDLATDPYEQVNLLDAPLSMDAQAAYDALRFELDQLVSP